MADGDTPTWFAELPEPVKAHITNRGHDKEEPAVAAAKLAEAHFAAQRLIGVPPEQILRLPKDGADPHYADAYKRVAAIGAPKEAAGYTLEGVPEATAARVRDMAVKLGLPAHVAEAIAADEVARETAATAKAAADAEVAAGVTNATLRQAWGVNYDSNLFKASKAIEALGWDKETADRIQGVVGGDKLMNAVLKLADQMGEAAVLRGGGGGTPAMTRDQAVIRKAEIMTEASSRKFTPAELAAAQAELGRLASIIVGPPPR